jgi:uncharacterized protein YbgA (DUF1722 family)/uncharacterized protein YbbK (DUF523 family)
MSEHIVLGISSCLMGEKVRYDGGHKLDHFLRDTMGRFVRWVSVCPEVECGLAVPREPMHLTGDPDHPRLVTTRTQIDHTEQMQKWILKKLDELVHLDLCGFVFKSKSPSSGMTDVTIYNDQGTACKTGAGLFAGAFMQRFPLLPVEDESRLNDPGLRENFIELIFVFKRWRDMMAQHPTPGDLVQFHSRHKLSLMSHSPALLRELGQMIAHGKDGSFQELCDRYCRVLMTALRLKSTVKKNVNVLQHAMGYFKKQLTAAEKQELLEVISHYHHGLFPLIAPVVLINHYIRAYDEPYLKQQCYFNPHPVELLLRNHV